MLSDGGTHPDREDRSWRTSAEGDAGASGHSERDPLHPSTSVSPEATDTQRTRRDSGESANLSLKSDVRTTPDPRTSEPREKTKRGKAAPNLVVNTAAHVRQSSSGAKNSSRTSPLGHDLAPFPTSTAPEAQKSPMSAGTRERGFSLRRAMLTRNVYNEAESSSSVVGMHLPDRRPSSVEPTEQQRMPGSPKKSKTTITITDVPVEPDHDRLASRLLKSGTSRTSLPHYETWLRSRVARSNVFTSLRAAYKRAHKKILGIQELPPSKDGRHVFVNVERGKGLIDERTHREHTDNEIRSCKYTAWNFLPRQLYAQFSKLANFYFLSVSILQMVIFRASFPWNIVCAESRDIFQKQEAVSKPLMIWQHVSSLHP